MATSYQNVLFLTLTTASAPSLSEAWAAQAAVRQRFQNNRFMSNADAWYRETEPTVSDAGWHLHDHWLLFLETNDADQLAALGELAVARWLASAHRAGVLADRNGQDPRVSNGIRDTLRYVTKGAMVQKTKPSRSHTMADVLALWHAGDADASEQWAELESFVIETRHRWKASGGRFRNTQPQ